jgi:hypothetical protein
MKDRSGWKMGLLAKDEDQDEELMGWHLFCSNTQRTSVGMAIGRAGWAGWRTSIPDAW